MAPELRELAEHYGVQTSYAAGNGHVSRADDAVLLAVLRALGAPVASRADVPDALAACRRSRAGHPLEPVLVHRIGSATTVRVTVPAGVHPRDVWCTVELEDGRVRRERLAAIIVGMAAQPELDGVRSAQYRFRLEQDETGRVEPGYHHVVVEWPGARASAVLIAAPACPTAARGWGVFLPLHAVRTDHDWGIGSYTDMRAVGEWVGGMGCSMLGALPLYPAFLDPPADPSPYLPVSRLAYNEGFVDPTVLPELEAAPDARRLLDADEFRRQLHSAHEATLVDYEAVSRLRRQVLVPLAEALLSGSSIRRDAFDAFVNDHPELVAYARFRAALDKPGQAEVGAGRLRPQGAGFDPALGYHLYAQWAAYEQLTATAASTPLYADLPIGVHPDGFDPQWASGAFAAGVHGGAPPDLFFSGGQDWAFPPLHPERMRDDGYGYFVAVVRRALRHAATLRVDHIMGLQRLYWIPEGFDARHGAYVSYRADELHAVVALEAHRAGAAIVGEDLGTVPDGVRSRMAHDAMLRSWVLQFESTREEPLPSPPAGVLASWGTHDLPRFGSYLAGDDIEERERDGLLPEAEAGAARTERAAWRRAFLRALGVAEGAQNVEDADSGANEVDAGGDVAARALRSCLLNLARSAADLVLVDLEELWGERQPQNRPGTVGAANWRRRAAYTLSEARGDKGTTDFLRSLDETRRNGQAAGTGNRVGALR